MNNRWTLFLFLPAMMAMCLAGCATPKQDKAEVPAAPPPVQEAEAPPEEPETPPPPKNGPDFEMVSSDIELSGGRPYLPVGAEIRTQGGRVPVREILKRLAYMHGFSLSWAGDVVLEDLVDVYVLPQDNFWDALTNILRQLDYFYEVEGDTIIVRYKVTRKYHLAMPFLKDTFKTAVGGNLLGSADSEGSMKADVMMGSSIGKKEEEAVTSSTQAGERSIERKVTRRVTTEEMDFWGEVKINLDRIIVEAGLEKERTVTTSKEEKAKGKAAEAGQVIAVPTGVPGEGPGTYSAGRQYEGVGATAIRTKETKKAEQTTGYFMIDRPLGIITVTAPKKTQRRVEQYLANLLEEVHKQVLIEARIIEVTLDDSSSLGINWNEVINQTLSGAIEFGKKGTVYPFPSRDGFISKITLDNTNFNLVINALKTQGDTKTLSNPKISLLNGHGATITVGKNVTYIDKVTTTTSTGGINDTINYTVETDTVLSGVGMAVMANIINDAEVILYIVPVTSSLEEPIEYRSFGGSNNRSEVGLPVIHLRELATYAKVGNGQTLIIGGLIDNVESDDTEGVPLLGDIPLFGYLFKQEKKTLKKRELVILIRPKIVTQHDYALRVEEAEKGMNILQ